MAMHDVVVGCRKKAGSNGVLPAHAHRTGRWPWLMACALLLILARPVAAAEIINPWTGFSTPSGGPARAIGAYQAGCVQGAVGLALSEPGLEVMRPGRRRFYGHPELVGFIRTLGDELRRGWQRVMLVGDMAMPRGGPTLSSHVSHQSGLDVDIWFDVLGLTERISAADRRQRSARRYVEGLVGALSAEWGPPQEALVRLSAEHPLVERVLVNPSIKRHLCARHAQGRTDTAGWLRKVRPWWGHADHMHVRLACPEGSGDCKSQQAPPPGNGCDASLDWWFTQEAADTLKQRRDSGPRRMPVLPVACERVAAAP
ncbi:MAG: penicillin-insensitive murein endopeptidase [Gammaproteobacteria bacterium]|nr:penicillin-insensitive murein endopeptidase [Gammaproteobacteria bacterium]